MNMATVERVLSTGLAAAGAVSPRLGGKLALRLFCTPIARPYSGGARTFMAEATRRDVSWGGGTVATYELGDGPAVLLVHGWSSHGASMRGFAHGLVERGLKAVSLDLPAHANSTGKTANMILAAEALTAVIAQAGPFPYAVCHSFGAPSMLLALSRGAGPAPERLVTVGAPHDIDKVFTDYAARFHVPPKAERNMRARIDDYFGGPFLDFDIAAQAWTFGDRLMVVHDRNDTDVPYAEGVRMAGEHGRLLATEGLGHNRVLRSPAVIDAVGDFLAQD